MRPLTLRSLARIAPAVVAAALLAACGNGTSSGPNASGGSAAATGTATTPVPDGSGATGGTGNGATGGTGSGSLAKVDACKLLTSSDAAAILGGPVGDGKTGSSLGIPYPSCTYSSTGSTFETVGLTVFDAAATANLINEYKSQFQGLTALNGLGDAALSEADGRLVVATKGGIGCVMLRAGDVTTSASTSTQLMSGICQKVFASA